MSGFGIWFSVLSMGVAIMALVILWRLRRDISEIKRDQYYLEQKLKGLVSRIESQVESTRIQLGLVAQGKPASAELIRQGRLYHEISGAEARAWLESPASDTVWWLDVRTPSEFSQRRVPGAHLIPVEELERRYHVEVPSTVEKLIVYCVTGDRSRLACDFLSRHDFGNVYYLTDGLQGWPGPFEGNQSGSLIQIHSKKARTSVEEKILTPTSPL